MNRSFEPEGGEENLLDFLRTGEVERLPGALRGAGNSAVVMPPGSEFGYEPPLRIVSGAVPINVPRTIVRKEIIPGIGVNEFELYRMARIVHIGFGRSGQALVHVWFECDTAQPLVSIRLRTYATGDMIPANPHQVYVGTAQDPSMSKAWHLYQEI